MAKQVPRAWASNNVHQLYNRLLVSVRSHKEWSEVIEYNHRSMKIRLGSLLNDLNITLETAKERLKLKGDRKVYTLNTVVSEEDIKLLSSYSHSLIESPKKKKKPKANNKSNQKPVSLKKPMASGLSFASCASYFNDNQKTIEAFADIRAELKRVFGNEIAISKLPLFKTKVIKGINVNYKYHYYALNGHKVLINHRCIATWLASIFSEAVNQEKITKTDYRQIYRTYLWKPIQSTKKKSVMPRKRPWVSIVSVPMGGMNKR